MKYSLNWLKDYVDIPPTVSPKELAEKLTLHIAEVEEVIEQARSFERMVVGRIEKIEDHPNADNLKICMVNIGAQLKLGTGNSEQTHVVDSNNLQYDKLKIICGGKNIYEGMKVAAALPGAKVRWHGEGDLVELKKIKIRGEESEGMILAIEELPLGIPHSGLQTPNHRAEPVVMDLGSISAEVGSPLADAYGMNDVIFDVENKAITNRPDLWGHFGMAREIAALFELPLKPYLDSRAESQILKAKQKQSTDKHHALLQVDVQAHELCRRYMGAVMDGLHVGPSPAWIQQRLEAVGQRPINNVVDITNYVMFDIGQPIHAFDAQKLDVLDELSRPAEYCIRIKKASDGEMITTLDGVQRTLRGDVLVIADVQKPVAIAGVIGGMNTEVDSKTISIVVEVANFDAVSVRRTASAMGLRTDASARFEKSLDAAQCEQALSRAMQLIQEAIPGAQLASPVVDAGMWQRELTHLVVPHDFINKKIGGEPLPENKIENILNRLGFAVTRMKAPSPLQPENSSLPVSGLVYDIVPPSWRSTGDISCPEDIIEEVARMSGYHALKRELPHVQISSRIHEPEPALIRKLHEYLSMGAGLTEIKTYSFVSARDALLVGNGQEAFIAMENPPSRDQELLRPSLFPGMWGVIQKMLPMYPELRLYEIGRVFPGRESLSLINNDDPAEFMFPQGEPMMRQPYRLCIAWATEQYPLRYLKGVLEGIGRACGIIMALREGRTHNLPQWLDANASLEVAVSETIIGYCGLISLALGARTKRKGTAVAVAEFDLRPLARATRSVVHYTKLARFPSVKRDIAFIVDFRVSYSRIVQIFDTIELLDSFELFDIFESPSIGLGKKSMAFHLSFVSPDHTLRDEEVDDAMVQLKHALVNSCHALIRDS